MPPLKLRRTRNREYSLSDKKKQLSRPAEYAVCDGKEVLLRIVLNGHKWRACQPTQNNKIGLAISPVGMEVRLTIVNPENED